MADHAEQLKSMLQDIINDRQENASAVMHDYFVSKMRDVAGLGTPQVDQFNDDHDFDDDYSNEDDE